MLKNSAARGTDAPWYQGWTLSDAERATFRATTLEAQEAKRRAVNGECSSPKHPVNAPKLDPNALMPQLSPNGLTALSLFSGGGGMDIGFDRAGFEHVASYEIMERATAVLKLAQPTWNVFGGADGDVRRVSWKQYRGKLDVLHGGPPCQPFSHAGRQNGSDDVRDMIPEFVRAVLEARPTAFACENVSGLESKRFAEYIKQTIHKPLQRHYTIFQFSLNAADFGVPQRRRRVFFIGFSEPEAAGRFEPPKPTHIHNVETRTKQSSTERRKSPFLTT